MNPPRSALLTEASHVELGGGGDRVEEAGREKGRKEGSRWGEAKASNGWMEKRDGDASWLFLKPYCRCLALHLAQNMDNYHLLNLSTTLT